MTHTGHNVGIFPMLLGIGMLLVGELGVGEFLMRCSLPVTVAGLILFHCGLQTLRLCIFPLLFFFSAIPLPALAFNAITFPLQTLAGQSAIWVLDAFGIAVTSDGNIIYLSNITLGIPEASKGIRSLISLVMLAAIWAQLTLPSIVEKAAFVFLTIPAIVVANMCRIVLTGVVSQAWGKSSATGIFQVFSGWVTFLVAVVFLATAHSALRLSKRVFGKDRVCKTAIE